MNIGLIGCSDITEKAVILPLEKTGFRVYGVASRNPAHAVEFAKAHHIDNWYEDYETLLKEPVIDAVYISLPSHLHADWICAALRAGKHVLCEKPLCLTVSEWERIKSALPGNLCLMEGIMTRCHPWQNAVYEMNAEGRYGVLRSVKTEMNIVPKPHFYTGSRSDPKNGGIFRDLSCYWLQFIQGLFVGEPTTFEGASDFVGPNGSDWNFHARIRDCLTEYTFDCAYGAPYKTNHLLEFEKATVTVHDFFRSSVGCYKMKIRIQEHNAEIARELVFEPAFYYENQLRFFENCIKSGSMPESMSCVGQRVDLMEKIYELAIKNRVK